jgi:hypothetical protein
MASIGADTSVSSRAAWATVSTATVSCGVHSVHSRTSIRTATTITSATTASASSVDQKLVHRPQIENLIEGLVVNRPCHLHGTWSVQNSGYS